MHEGDVADSELCVHACLCGYKQIHCITAVKTLAMAAGICPRHAHLSRHSHATTIHQRQCQRQHTLAVLCRNNDRSIVSILQDLEYMPPPSPRPDVEKNPPSICTPDVECTEAIPGQPDWCQPDIIMIRVPRHAKFPLDHMCCQLDHPRTLWERFS